MLISTYFEIKSRIIYKIIIESQFVRHYFMTLAYIHYTSQTLL